MEQGKCLCERWLSVKAGTGRHSGLTSEGKDFPKPLCKTTVDPAADRGTRTTVAALHCLLSEVTISPEHPRQSFHLSPEHHQPRQEIETVWNHERWEWRLRSRYYLADMICLECGSASVNLNRHASNVAHNNRRVKQSSAVLTWVHELFSELHKAYDSYTT